MNICRALLLTYCLFSFFALFGQNKVISGIIIDESTHKRVAHVSITPSFNNEQIVSDSNGKFKLILPKAYYDTLIFTHPEYFSHIIRVNRGSNLKLNFISLIPTSFNIDTICYLAYKDNFRFTGTVIDDYRDEPVLNAVLSLENETKVAYTNNSGRFSVVIPVSQENLILSHPDFIADTIQLQFNGRSIRSVDVKLTRVNFTKEDTNWRSFKNTISMSINELVFGSVGLSYQRFVALRHAIGVHSSTYFNGDLPGFNTPHSKFKGIKASMHYRFYEKRKMRKSNFFELKIITGYFDFNKLYYAPSSDARRGEHYSENFWTFGFGGGLGWSILPRSKHAILTLSAGFQVFPTHVPRTKSRGSQTLYVEDLPWYIVGPGSGLEIKISLGGIF